MVYITELIGVVFVLIMIYFTYIELKRKRINRVNFLFWLILWSAIIILIIFHNNINVFLDPLNIIRVLDLYIILSIMFIFATIFYLYVKNGITEKRLEEITRILALKQIEKENDKKT